MPSTADLNCSHLRRSTLVMLYTEAETPSVRFIVDLCKLVSTICRQQIDQVKFEPHLARMCKQLTAVGLCNNVLSNIVRRLLPDDYTRRPALCAALLSIGREAASRSPSASADILVSTKYRARGSLTVIGNYTEIRK